MKQKRVLCVVLKPVGYHDDHEPGEIIPIDVKHVVEMIEKGYVRLLSDNR
jgi:hypothetical protein